MTTIAYKDGVLAADSLWSCGVTLGYHCKIEQMTDGRFVASTGSDGNFSMFKAWYNRGADSFARPPYEDEGYFSVLIVNPDGSLEIFGDGLKRSISGTLNEIAIGSGATYALGAMSAGASAIEAVRIAMKHDVNTGGFINHVTAGDTEIQTAI